MSAEALLSRLQKVRSTGTGTWLACCPAHDDRTPSLTVRECPDGRVLVHCFAGCGFEEIVRAAGVSIDELFPPRQASDFKPGLQRRFPAADVLAALSAEAQIVRLAAANIAAGVTLADCDRDRLALAQERIAEGMRLSNG